MHTHVQMLHKSIKDSNPECLLTEGKLKHARISSTKLRYLTVFLNCSALGTSTCYMFCNLLCQYMLYGIISRGILYSSYVPSYLKTNDWYLSTAITYVIPASWYLCYALNFFEGRLYSKGGLWGSKSSGMVGIVPPFHDSSWDLQWPSCSLSHSWIYRALSQIALAGKSCSLELICKELEVINIYI